MSGQNLLLVDDDATLVEMMREYLEPEGFDVAIGHDGSALADPASLDRDLILLDIMLPGRSGLEILKEFRRRSLLPVILLTARDSDVDRIVGLEVGADDYVSKPFNPRELVARIRAVLRRAQIASPAQSAPSAPPALRAGDVTVSPTSREAWLGGVPLDLSTAEFNLLEHLLRRRGAIVSRDDLSRAAFGRDVGLRIDRNVDTLVSKLRRKIDPGCSRECRIKTVRNAGYLYVLEPDDLH